jgi:hypothetical protein
LKKLKKRKLQKLFRKNFEKFRKTEDVFAKKTRELSKKCQNVFSISFRKIT